MAELEAPRWLRPSAMGTLAACPASGVQSEGHINPASDATELGKAWHRVAEAWLTRGEGEARLVLEQLDARHRKLCEEWLPPLAPHLEHWRQRGGIVVEAFLEARFATRVGVVVVRGTADLVVFDMETGAPEVVDWKSGDPEYASPGTMLQAETYTTGAAQQAGTDRGVATLCYIRAGNDGWSSVEVDRYEAEGRIGEIVERALVQRELAPESREYRVGEACRFCPARVACPAYQQDLRAFQGLIEAPGWEVTAENAAPLYDRALLVGKLADAAKKAVQAFVEAQGGEVVSGDRRLYVKEVPPAPVAAHVRSGYIRLYSQKVKA